MGGCRHEILCGGCAMGMSLLDMLSMAVLIGFVVLGLLHYRLDRKKAKAEKR